MRRTKAQVDLEAAAAHARRQVGAVVTAGNERLLRADPDLKTAEGQGFGELLAGLEAVLTGLDPEEREESANE